MEAQTITAEAREQCALAVKKHKAGNTEEAIEILYEAIQKWPDNADLYNNLGCCLVAMGFAYHINVIKSFERAIALNPDDPNAAANLAEVMKHMPSRIGPLSNKGMLNVDYSNVYQYEGLKMETYHAVPWAGDKDSEFFLKASQDAVNLELVDVHTYSGITMPEKMFYKAWNNWIVTYAMRHAIEFTEQKELNAVECGVKDGTSAFFAMKELKGFLDTGRIDSFCMHLYDSWAGMREEGLTEGEKCQIGLFDDNDIDRTKRNLSEFEDNTVYHRGFIPESLYQPPEAPEKISYIHIDINSAKPSIDALEFYFPRLLRGGVVLLDDHGWNGFMETREATIEFFADKPGTLMPSPTGQAIYFR